MTNPKPLAQFIGWCYSAAMSMQSVRRFQIAFLASCFVLPSCGDDETGGNGRFDGGMRDATMDAVSSQEEGAIPDASQPGPGCQMASGFSHTCARLEDQRVFCWGSNEHGQIGASVEVRATEPTEVSGLSGDALSIAVGSEHSCAIKADHSVWCWGQNFQGSAGVAAEGDVTTPTQVSGLPDISAVSLSQWNSCALDMDGKVWCWGDNSQWQLGVDTVTHSATPIEVTALGSDNRSLVAHFFSGCVLKENGRVWCWGELERILGTGNDNVLPREMTEFGTDNVELDLSNMTICVRKSDDSVHCLGKNEFGGVLGDGTNTGHYATSQQLPSLPEPVARIALLGSSTCLLTSASNLYCWGNNTYGQLGIGTQEPVYEPTLVADLEGRVSRVDGAGWEHACVREEDGTIWCWGFNEDGQVGDGTTDVRTTPTKVSGIVCPPLLR